MALCIGANALKTLLLLYILFSGEVNADFFTHNRSQISTRRGRQRCAGKKTVRAMSQAYFLLTSLKVSKSELFMNYSPQSEKSPNEIPSFRDHFLG